MKMKCRVCMQSKCHVLIDMGIAFTEDGKTLYDYFNECTQLQASANDNFPKTLCKTCAQELQIAYNFRTCALQSHEDFKQLLASQKMETESVLNSTEEMYKFEDIEDNNDDPLDMDFNEALRALREPELEFPKEEKSIDESSNQFLEEIREQSEKDSICLSEFTIKQKNEVDQETGWLPEVVEEDQPLKQMAIESEKEQTDEESETEPIEKVGYACEICSRSFSIKNELKKHIAKRHKSDIICVNCSKVFDMPNEMRIHQKLVHDTDSPVQCDFCIEKPLMPRAELLKHFQNYHSCRYFKYFPRLRQRRPNYLGVFTPYVCKYCSNIFSTAFELEDHMKGHVFQCPFCSKNFNRVRTYYTHAKRLHNCSASNFPPTPFIVEGVEMGGEKPIECKACNKSYRNLGSYNTHIKQKHKKKTDLNTMNSDYMTDSPEKQIGHIQKIETIVDHADREFNQLDEDEWDDTTFNNLHTKDFEDDKEEQESSETKSRKNSQEMTDGSEKQNYDIPPIESLVDLADDEDGWEDTTYNNLRSKHLEDDQDQQKSSKTKSRKNSHKPKLKEKKRYLCSFCPRVLSTYLSLESHERKQHLNIPSELKECPICQKKFSPDYLRKHIDLVHIGERNFICDICHGSYKTKNQLYRHRQLHQKERNFPCTICDKSFPDKSDLRIHMRVHTGELPFECHLCDRRFRIKVRLTYHLQHHANIKRKCKECGKEFKNGTSLRIHSYEHADIMPYTCLICNYGSVKREYFIKHMLRKHDTTMTADELFDMFKANTGRTPYVKPVDEIEMKYNGSSE